MKTKAFITDKCIGCARCIAICPVQAIHVEWNETGGNTQRKMVEYAYGVFKSFKQKIIFLNILTSMSPACDCYPGNDEPMTHDIGFLASLDPVAIDKASYDLVLNQAGFDPFKKEYSNIDINAQFEHIKKIGFGSLDYELIKVE